MSLSAKRCTNKKCSRPDKTTDEFHRDSGRDDGLSPWCKECANANARRYHSDGPILRTNRARQKISKQEAANRNRANAQRYVFAKVYGITVETFAEMIAAQNGRCSICTQLLEQPCVDHDHASGKVRAVLCRKCNSMIGLAGENVDTILRAAAYLDHHKTSQETKVTLS